MFHADHKPGQVTPGMSELNALCDAQEAESNKPDFRVSNHGSICILWALSEAAQLWVDEHLPEDAMTWGQNGTVVEPRYIGPIVEGIQADDYTVEA